MFRILEERAPQIVQHTLVRSQQTLATGRALNRQAFVAVARRALGGIAHRLKIEIFDAIKRIQQGGTTILMAEQDAQLALRIADRIYVLEHGHVGREGTSAELGSDDYIRQAYLGVD